MPGKRRTPERAVIDGVTHDGRGITAVDGKKVFVAGALVGETVRFLRRKRHRRYDEAELLEVIEASPSRIGPRCAAYGRCGGCALQHVADAEQREQKSRVLADNLERIGRVIPETWLEPLHAADSWQYRRRARLAVKDVAAKGRVLVGFRERHSPYVCDMHRCEVLAKPVDGLIDPLSELIGQLSIRHRLPQVEVAVADDATALVFRVLDPPTAGDLAALTEFGVRHGLQIGLQRGGPDSVESLVGEAALVYSLPAFDIDIEFDATDFVQINGAVNRLMVSRAIELLRPGPGDRVLDLFCGIGNFSLPLARRARAVLGIEGESRQVRRARDNARRNGIDNCEFRQADLAVLDGSETWLRESWDRVLLDPARSGAEAIVSRIDRTGATRLVYVSCHPGTLARDAGILVHDRGFVLEAAGIIDMFPHTGHVEALSVFRKD